MIRCTPCLSSSFAAERVVGSGWASVLGCAALLSLRILPPSPFPFSCPIIQFPTYPKREFSHCLCCDKQLGYQGAFTAFLDLAVSDGGFALLPTSRVLNIHCLEIAWASALSSINLSSKFSISFLIHLFSIWMPFGLPDCLRIESFHQQLCSTYGPYYLYHLTSSLTYLTRKHQRTHESCLSLQVSALGNFLR